jgi:translation initiation factor 2 alpha subunit (eIF-2alpha)
MFFYHNELPNVNDIVMCTVSEYTDAGFKVTLDEYDDAEGFIPLSELSQKRIRKNPATFLKVYDKHPVSVVSLENQVVEVSLKDVKEDNAELCRKKIANILKLYSMCQRLEHITKVEKNVWKEAFKSCISNTGADLFDALHNEQQILEGRSGLPKHLDQLILENYTQLFGFNTTVIHKNILIQCFRSDGNQYVKNVLARICPPEQKDNWTTEELSQDPERANISVKLIGLPKILLTVTAMKKDTANQKMTEAMNILTDAKFNILMEV